MDIHKHWLRQEISRGQIGIEWVSTNNILADGLTKSLPPQRQKQFIRLLGLGYEKGNDEDSTEGENLHQGDVSASLVVKQ